MRSFHNEQFDHRRSILPTLKRTSSIALGAMFIGSMFFAPSATAQATTTVAGETTTTLAPTDTTIVDGTVTAESSEAAVEVEDTAVPEGGVDAGFGGSAPDDGPGAIIPVAVGTLLVGGFAASRLARARRVN